MTFEYPERLALLGLALAAAVAWIREPSRLAILRRRLGVGLVEMPGRRLGGLMNILAIACLAIAAAVPRWGRSAIELPPGRDLIFLIDASLSMAASDAVPSRGAVAVECASSIIDALADQPGDRVGVVAFAGVPSVRCGLTENLGAARETLRTIEPGSIRPGGSDLAAALETALDGFDDRERSEGRVIVLLSDGEDLAGSSAASFERAADRGVVVHTVSIGDDLQGSTVATARDELLLHQGKPVVTRRRDDLLKRISESTGGVFIPLGTSHADLAALYRERLLPRERARRASDRGLASRPADRSSWFVLLALGAWLGSIPLSTKGPRLGSIAIPGLCILMIGAGRGEDRSPTASIEAGIRAYEASEFEISARAFQEAFEMNPSDPVAAFDLGAALYRLGRVRDAEARYRTASESARGRLTVLTSFAIGNCRVLLEDPASAIRFYDEALAAVDGLEDSGRLRAEIELNREFARKMLEPPEPEAPEGGPPRSDPNARDSNEPAPGNRKREATGDPSNRGDEPQGEPAGGDSGAKAGGGGGDSVSGRGTESPESRLAAAVDAIRRVKAAAESRSRPQNDGPRDPQGRDW
ncbi:MAG: VWA domain-containing protein [Isosphaeraceae bacterium]|nr:VWA domain-containing protein [Isosphaeraceae bacterium]